MRRLLILFSIFYVFICGCTEKRYFIGDDPVLYFSVDTVYFDTVFTSIGTSTRELRVVNKSNRWVILDEISIAGTSSSFRLNIDGQEGNSREEVEIAPGDSLFIFIDAIIDPNNTNNPVSINDSILFLYGSIVQDINILAWGQDINLIQGEEIASETWTEGKPYVIYNSMMVDTGETLTISEGARIMFHRGSTMYVAGTLIVEGSLEKRVVFSSDRVEAEYGDIPGQWEGIYFFNGSSGNSIENADIINAVSAIHLGNLGTSDDPPDLELNNSRIFHNSVAGISSLGGSIQATNCVITHCGYYSLFLALGGAYSFTHCSIHSYWDYSIRTNPGVYISDNIEYRDNLYIGTLDSSIFSNTSLTGSLQNEIEIFSINDDILNCQFNNCLLSIDEDLGIWDNYDLTGSYIDIEPGYISIYDYDLRPDTLSILIDNADPLISVTIEYDIRSYSRNNDLGPDIGAYERQIGESSLKKD